MTINKHPDWSAALKLDDQWSLRADHFQLYVYVYVDSLKTEKYATGIENYYTSYGSSCGLISRAIIFNIETAYSFSSSLDFSIEDK